MGMNSFAPFIKKNTFFVVMNIANPPKVVNIFQYPILSGTTRDLLMIPGIGESDIRASLLKGEINHKIKSKEITVVQSDIDLLQFNNDQKIFLENAGIIKGLQVDYTNINVLHQEDIQLVGVVDGANTTFIIPSGVWIQSAPYKIIVYKNGVKQVYLDDYIIAEGGGVGTGYNTVIFTIPPTVTPSPVDVITADYYISNT
jgi:hypothetical protein